MGLEGEEQEGGGVGWGWKCRDWEGVGLEG